MGPAFANPQNDTEMRCESVCPMRFRAIVLFVLTALQSVCYRSYGVSSEPPAFSQRPPSGFTLLDLGYDRSFRCSPLSLERR